MLDFPPPPPRRLSEPRILPTVSEDGPRRVTFSASITIASIFQSDIRADIYRTIHPPPPHSYPHPSILIVGRAQIFFSSRVSCVFKTEAKVLPYPDPNHTNFLTICYYHCHIISNTQRNVTSFTHYCNFHLKAITFIFCRSYHCYNQFSHFIKTYSRLYEFISYFSLYSVK